MDITPLDIQNRQFRVKFRGFDVKEVDAFLEQVAAALRALSEGMERTERALARSQRDVAAYREREETFKSALANSQTVMEQMKSNAKKSAGLIIADAEVKAQKLLQTAHKQLSQLHEDIAELKRQRQQIESQIQSIIETHTKILETGKEEMKANDAQDDRMQLLNFQRKNPA
jgi:cell division initiation protein